MKAVIVEVKGKFAAALSNDATVVKVKNQNYVIGQVIEMTQTTSTVRKMALRVSAIAAAFVLTFGLGAGSYAYFAPNSYVSMDVNPSIEYTLNMFDRVLSVNAVNEDGAHLLQEFNLKDFNNKTIDEVIKLTLAEIDKEGYFNGDVPGGIVIATSGKNHAKAEALAEALGELVKTQCKETGKTVKVETLAADQQMIDEAKALGVTPGKLRLVQELMEDYKGTEPFDAAAWLKKPVKDIMAEAERLDELEDAAEDEADAAQDALDAEEDALEEETDALDDEKDAAEDAAEDEADALKDAEEDLKDAEEDKKDAAREAAEKAADVKKKEAEKKAEAEEKLKEAEEKKLEEAEEAAEAKADEEEEAADREDDEDEPKTPAPKPTEKPAESPKPSQNPQVPATPAPSEAPDAPDTEDGN
ncbi:MAG: hypothetical protein RR226_01720 [Oscillospiraceae bacterium]